MTLGVPARTIWVATAAIAIAAGVFFIDVVFKGFVIRETPTQVSLNVVLGPVAPNTLMDSVDSVMKRDGCKESFSKSNYRKWSCPNVQAIANVDSKNELAVVVETTERRSRDYEMIAKDVEVALVTLAQPTGVKAWITRDATVYHCNPKCSTSVSIPVDFENLNQTTLAFPSGG